MTDCTIPAHLLRQRVYLLHFYNPTTGQSAKLAHAAHYLGVSESVSQRLAEHGTERGARASHVCSTAGRVILGCGAYLAWRPSPGKIVEVQA